MNFDPGQMNQLLSNVHFPISKADLIKFAQQHNANEHITNALERLPDKVFGSQQDLQNNLANRLGGLGNPGDFKL